jgi:peptidoglycan LD-endopeptidase CwlK
MPGAAAVMSPNTRRTDLEGLHPKMRRAAVKLLEKLAAEGISFRIFEAYRSPARQAWLFEQGRSRPGAKVTNARAWESYHQYGMAVDFVLWVNNTWSWETTGVHKNSWKRLQQVGTELGLEALSFELPHLQVAGLKLSKLQAGAYPVGGDDSWFDNLEATVIGWSGLPAAPLIASSRPPLET